MIQTRQNAVVMENLRRNKPKLDRKNAVKNIEYDASYSPSTSTSSSSSSFFFTQGSTTPRTRSLDSDSKTSFRIKGIDGEFDVICRSLGFSSPEDFAIPTDVWEAQKARRASFDVSTSATGTAAATNKVSVFKREFDISNNNSSNSNLKSGLGFVQFPNNEVTDRVNDGSSSNLVNVETRGNVISDFGKFQGRLERKTVNFDAGARIRDNKSKNDEDGDGSNDLVAVDTSGNGVNFESEAIRVFDDGDLHTNRNGVTDFNKFKSGAGFLGQHRHSVRSVGVSGNGGNGPGDGGGIKGDRPPALAPPPIRFVRPVVDDGSSTWELLKSFAPGDDEGNLIRGGEEGSSSDEEDEEIADSEDNEDEDESDGNEETEQLNGEIVVQNEVLSEPRLSPSNDDGGGIGEDYVAGNSIRTADCVPAKGKLRCITSWIKGELLGSGSFGTVYEALTEDGLFFAVKEVSLLDQGSQGKQSILQLEQEISMLREFEHENIVRYLGTEKDDAKLYIFLELATKGSLAKLYQKYNLRDSQVSAYTRKILNGLKYLHDRNVVHRDIKCANILVDANGSVKLADFGLAKATTMNDVKSCKGTAFWMAPEVVNSRNQSYGLPADIWSLGCTVLEMLTGRPPYSHLEGMQALFRIGKGEPPLVPDSLSPDARDFILKCLQVNPKDRPPAAQLLDHPFLKRPHTSLSPPSPRFTSLLS